MVAKRGIRAGRGGSALVSYLEVNFHRGSFCTPPTPWHVFGVARSSNKIYHRESGPEGGVRQVVDRSRGCVSGRSSECVIKSIPLSMHK